MTNLPALTSTRSPSGAYRIKFEGYHTIITIRSYLYLVVNLSGVSKKWDAHTGNFIETSKMHAKIMRGTDSLKSATEALRKFRLCQQLVVLERTPLGLGLPPYKIYGQ